MSNYNKKNIKSFVVLFFSPSDLESFKETSYLDNLDNGAQKKLANKVGKNIFRLLVPIVKFICTYKIYIINFVGSIRLHIFNLSIKVKKRDKYRYIERKFR